MTTDTDPPTSLTAWERWELASFEDNGTEATPTANGTISHSPTADAEEINRLREAAHLEGYQQGFNLGQQAATLEARQIVAQLTQLVSRFEVSLDELDHVVADELLALAIEIARKVTQQTIATHPQVILGVIQAALAQLQLQQAVIYLHPDDIALINTLGETQFTSAGHRIQENARLARGDVVIESGTTHLDARVATRWQHALSALGQDTPWLAADSQEPV